MGHVNNTVYFRFMEQTRIEWFFALEGDRGGYTSGVGPVIVNASCTFERPLVYPGDVEVRMSIGERGRSSFESYYELDCRGERYAHGAARIVWIDVATGKSVPLPASIAQLVPARDGSTGGGHRCLASNSRSNAPDFK